jgi:hypothetical protein
MSFRRSNLGWLLAASLVAIGCLCAPGAWAQGKTQSWRQGGLSETNSSQAMTNLNQLNNLRSGVPQTEDDLERSDSPFDLRNPTARGDFRNRTPVRVSRPSPPTERQRNWILPEEMSTQDGVQELFKASVLGADRSERKTALEQFYDRLNTRTTSNAGKTSAAREEDASPRRRLGVFSESGEEDSSGLPGSVGDKAQALQKLLRDESSPAAFSSGKSGLSGLVRPGGNLESRRAVEAHRAYIESFRSVLEGSRGAAPVTFSGSTFDASSRGGVAYGGGLMESSAREAARNVGELQSQIGNLNAAFKANLLPPDPSIKALNDWNPLYNSAAPKLQAPKPPAPSRPDDLFPRRTF